MFRTFPQVVVVVALFLATTATHNSAAGLEFEGYVDISRSGECAANSYIHEQCSSIPIDEGNITTAQVEVIAEWHRQYGNEFVGTMTITLWSDRIHGPPIAAIPMSVGEKSVADVLRNNLFMGSRETFLSPVVSTFNPDVRCSPKFIVTHDTPHDLSKVAAMLRNLPPTTPVGVFILRTDQRTTEPAIHSWQAAAGERISVQQLTPSSIQRWIRETTKEIARQCFLS